MPTSIELRQQRTRVVEQTRELVDRAETDNRDLDATERESYTRLNTEFEQLTGRIQRVEEQEARELETADEIPNPDDPGGNPAGRGGRGGRGYRESNLPDDAPDREARMAFLDMIRYGNGISPEARALVEDAAGQILVPEALETELRRSIPALTVIRNIVSQRNLTRDRVRRRSLDEVTVGWGKLETGGQVLTDSMPAVPTEEFTHVEDLYGLAKIGEDELDDSDVDLEAFVQDSFARALAEAEDTGFTVGAGHGSEEPVGFMTAGGGVTAVDAGQTGAVTIDDFKALIYAVPAQARRNGRFVLASTTELAISILKDANDQYLWQASNQAGRPNTFIGYALENQEDVPAIPAGGVEAKVAAFGDFMQGYRAYDRLGMTLKRLEELYAEDGMIGFKVRRRVTGDVVNPAYLRLLSVPAA